MVQTIYLDSYFVINTYLNYLIITLLHTYPGIDINTQKRCVIALLGTLLSLPSIFLKNSGFGILSAVAMIFSLAIICKTIAGTCRLRKLLQMFGLLITYTFMMGGGVLLCNADGFLSLAICALVIFFIIRWSVRTTDRYVRLKKYLYDVCIIKNGNEVKMKGLVDTGNRLYDPVYGKPVIVVSESFKYIANGCESSFCCIPYKTAGVEYGMLEGVKLDKVIISDNEKVMELNDIICAFSECALTDEAEYQMLLHPDIINWS